VNHLSSIEILRRCQNWTQLAGPGLAWGITCFCPSGIRCRGGVTSTQAFIRNAGTSRFDVKGEAQVEDLHKRASTDAKHWGGMTRSSDEATAMVAERRGRVVRYCLNDQPPLVGGVG
jgi:hypothetical protein